jgi:hypothetical protein
MKDRVIGRTKLELKDIPFDQVCEATLKLDTQGTIRVLVFMRPILNRTEHLDSPNTGFSSALAMPKRRFVLESSTYFSGSTIRGAFVFAAHKKVKLQNIRITFSCDTHYYWYTTSTDKNGHTTTHDHYVRAFPVRKAAYIASSDLPQKSKFEPGIHVLPFSIQLPSTLPPSMSSIGANPITYQLKANMAKSMAIDKQVSQHIEMRGVPPSMLPKEPTSFSFESGGIKVTLSAVPVLVQGRQWSFDLDIENGSETRVKELKLENKTRKFMSQSPHGISKLNYGCSEADAHKWDYGVGNIHIAGRIDGKVECDIGAHWHGTVSIDLPLTLTPTIDRTYAFLTDFENKMRFKFLLEGSTASLCADLVVFVAKDPDALPPCASAQLPNGSSLTETKIFGATIEETLPILASTVDAITAVPTGSSYNTSLLSNPSLTPEMYNSQWEATNVKRDRKHDELPTSAWTYAQVPTQKYRDQKRWTFNLDTPIGIWTFVTEP